MGLQLKDERKKSILLRIINKAIRQREKAISNYYSKKINLRAESGKLREDHCNSSGLLAQDMPSTVLEERKVKQIS